jgi:hypothetical protein
MPNQFGSDQPERICTKKVSYDLKFRKAYPGRDGQQAAALGLALLTGSITEKYECMNPAQLAAFRAQKQANGGKLTGTIVQGSGQPIMPGVNVSLTCNPENPIDGLFNQVMQLLLNTTVPGLGAGRSFKDLICDDIATTDIYDLKFYGSCYYELDECDPTETPENTELGGIIHPPDRQREQCWYEGNAAIDTFNGLEVPYDSILGYIPEDICSLPDNYQSQCNFAEIFLDKLGDAQLSASIGNIIQSALFTVATGGSFSIFDILGVIGKIENPRVREYLDTILNIYEEALAEYLDCLKSELGL